MQGRKYYLLHDSFTSSIMNKKVPQRKKSHLCIAGDEKCIREGLLQEVEFEEGEIYTDV